MDDAKLKRQIGIMLKGGIALEKVLAEIPPSHHERVRRLWKERAANPPRKIPSYREAIEFIALNDEPTNLVTDPDHPDWVGHMATVALTAALFGKEREKIAADVVAYRRKALDR